MVLWGTTAAAQPAGSTVPSGGAAAGLSRSFAAVARAIAPAVVRLDVAGPNGKATGSGIVLDTRGNVVTSEHVLDGSAIRPEAGGIQVTVADGRQFPAELVGGDAATDVAVVRIVDPPADICAARFGDSDEAAVGEWVLAVGSALGLDETFTAGIISGRPELTDPEGVPAGAFLLTDAKVNPGDAGGPLVDLEGQVVGLTTLISAGPGGGYGYAVPINQVRRIAQEIVKEGHAGHPYIGVGLRDLGDVRAAQRDQAPAPAGALPVEGALVSRVGRGTPAARAGLRAGDVITAVDDRDVPAPAELVTIIQREPVGAQVALSFLRGGRPHKVVISVEDLPAR
ncbi:MAG TPA: trypsin-like peptidase domain-containing protein [Polyangia bacterium]|nr:trypsin-like peptidase domain-containing protein [Polyangia bacterium]